MGYHLSDSQSVDFSYIWNKDTTKGVFNALRRDGRKSSSSSKPYYGDTYLSNKQQWSVDYKIALGEIDATLGVYDSSLLTESLSSSYASITEMKDTVFKAEASMAVSDNYIVTGLEYRKEHYDRDYTDPKRTDFKDSINYISAFVQDEMDFENFVITSGVRLDKHQNFGANIAPKLYGIYKLSDSSRLKVGYGEAFSAPNIQQTSDKYILDRTSSTRHYAIWRGNPDVKPQTSKTYEAGYEMVGDDSSLSATLFMGTIDDLISIETYVRGDYKNKKVGKATYKNIAHADTKGVEIDFSQNAILDSIDFNSNYTFLDIAMRNGKEPGGRPLNMKPKHTANASMAYNYDDMTKATLSAQYIGEIQLEDTTSRSGEKMPGRKYSPYTTYGLTVTQHLTSDSMMTIGVNNLTNKRLDDLNRAEIRSRYIYFSYNMKF